MQDISHFSSSGNRLSNFQILVDGQVCATETGSLGAGETKIFPCKAMGKTVRIQLNGRNYLTLCEVEVYGRKLENNNNNIRNNNSNNLLRGKYPQCAQLTII